MACTDMPIAERNTVRDMKQRTLPSTYIGHMFGDR